MKTLSVGLSLLAFSLLAAPLGWAQEKNATDQDDAALPDRAVCRLGSNRFLHDDFIVATAFSPDGNKFASASAGGRSIIWEWPSGKPLHRGSDGDGQFVRDAAMRFSPGRQMLAVGR